MDPPTPRHRFFNAYLLRVNSVKYDVDAVEVVVQGVILSPVLHSLLVEERRNAKQWSDLVDAVVVGDDCIV